MTGVAPPECPWRCLDDPLVQDVMQVYFLHDAGLCEAAVGGDWSRAPAELVRALVTFDDAYRRTRAECRKRRKRERELEAARRRRG